MSDVSPPVLELHPKDSLLLQRMRGTRLVAWTRVLLEIPQAVAELAEV